MARCLPGKLACKPRIVPTPSGKRDYYHADDCPTHPGKRLDAAEYPGSQPVGSEPWRWRRPRW